MPKYIIKLTDNNDNKDYYLEWSTIVDAPITYGVDLEWFKKGYIRKYGTYSESELNERLKRVEKNGCSALDYSLDELIEYNRAGDNESCLTKEELIEKYCHWDNCD